jgi:hypothetical protein
LKSLCAVVVLIGGFAILGGCRTGSPEQAFNALAEAAERGDEESFLAGFTIESRPLVAGILSMAVKYPKMLALGPFHRTVRAHSASRVGELALVSVTGADSREDESIVMRFQDGEWRLDLVLTQLRWQQSSMEFENSPQTSGIELNPASAQGTP